MGIDEASAGSLETAAKLEWISSVHGSPGRESEQPSDDIDDITEVKQQDWFG
jgi:hypothetical protein